MSRIDFIPYPPTGFALHDLLVVEQLPIAPTDTICTIGVGTGATVARLARRAAAATGLDASKAKVRALRYLESRHRNLRLVVADARRPEMLAPLAEEFTRVVACEPSELGSEPARAFVSIARLLSHKGEFLITFPNRLESPRRGAPLISDAKALRTMLETVGLPQHFIGAARLIGGAKRIAHAFGAGPLAWARSLVRRRPLPESASWELQSRRGDADGRLTPLLNLYWYGVLRRMEAVGPCFEIDWDFRQSPFTDCQLFVTGRKA